MANGELIAAIVTIALAVVAAIGTIAVRIRRCQMCCSDCVVAGTPTPAPTAGQPPPSPRMTGPITRSRARSLESLSDPRGPDPAVWV